MDTIVKELKTPPDDHAALVLKPSPENFQIAVVAMIETAFLAIGSSFSIFIGVVVIGMFFEGKNSFFPSPLILGLAVSGAWFAVHLVVGGLFIRYRKYAAMAPKMEYHFFSDRMVYTVGDSLWWQVPYDALIEVQVTHKKHLTLVYRPELLPEGKDVRFAARRIPSIPHPDSACNEINRLLAQHQAVVSRS